MTLAGTFKITLTLALVLIAAYPLGAFIAEVFENRRTFLTPIVGPIERGLYHVAGVDPEAEQKWPEYTISTRLHAYWVDTTRATLYVLLPLSLVVALAFAALGVPQTLNASVRATTLESAKQIIALGPAARPNPPRGLVVGPPLHHLVRRQHSKLLFTEAHLSSRCVATRLNSLS